MVNAAFTVHILDGRHKISRKSTRSRAPTPLQPLERRRCGDNLDGDLVSRRKDDYRVDCRAAGGEDIHDGSRVMVMATPKKKWEMLFWGAATGIFILSATILIFMSHIR
jgi:hypothetical protein